MNPVNMNSAQRSRPLVWFKRLKKTPVAAAAEAHNIIKLMLIG